MTEQEIIQNMIKQKKEAIIWLGASGKKERERLTLQAFLRCLGFSFQPGEIRSIDDQFPDVNFKSTNFEIKEMMDLDRKRHDEYKGDLEKLKTAKGLADLLEQYHPIDLSINDIWLRSESIFTKLCKKYPTNQRKATQLLIYCNLQDVYVKPPENIVNSTQLDRMGWESVSVIGSSWCYVFTASITAPPFIYSNVGRFREQNGCWD